MEPVRRPDWPTDPEAAIEMQIRLARAAAGIRIGRDREVSTVAGLDAAYDEDARRVWGAVAVTTVPACTPVAQSTAEASVGFPYVPGLFAFREGPVLVEALCGLGTSPDLLLVDAAGIAHPRRFGLAVHIGRLFDVPSVGCTKSLPWGDADEPGPGRGSTAPIRVEGEEVGAAVRTREGTRPLYVSPGFSATTDEAVEIVLGLSGPYRVPAPLRLAHALASEARSARGSTDGPE